MTMTTEQRLDLLQARIDGNQARIDNAHERLQALESREPVDFEEPLQRSRDVTLLSIQTAIDGVISDMPADIETAMASDLQWDDQIVLWRETLNRTARALRNFRTS